MALRIDTDLHEVLPEYYRGIADYEEIMDTEESELEALAAFIQAVHDNFFLQTMNEATATAWERLLGISALPGDTLEFRRIRILNRISTRPPFSLGFLYEKLDELIGPGKWVVDMDYANYTLYIESAAESQDYAVEVAFTVNHIKPAHIAYVNRPYLSDTALLSETIGASTLQYNYVLGSWNLGARPFVTDYEEVNYKVATTNSLTGELIGDVAVSVKDDISKARVNGTSIITGLTKTVSDGTVTVTYTVPQGTVSTINKVELLDSSNNVLTSSNVYIPAASAVEMKHRILVKEGV